MTKHSLIVGKILELDDAECTVEQHLFARIIIAGEGLPVSKHSGLQNPHSR
jgi:hypothetical protein